MADFRGNLNSYGIVLNSYIVCNYSVLPLRGAFHQGSQSIARMDVGKNRELGAEVLR